MTPKKLAEAEYDFQTVSLLVQDILDHADFFVGHGFEIQTLSQRRQNLKSLTWIYLERKVQEKEHDSVKDARAAVGLYLLVSIEMFFFAF